MKSVKDEITCRIELQNRKSMRKGKVQELGNMEAEIVRQMEMKKEHEKIVPQKKKTSF